MLRRDDLRVGIESADEEGAGSMVGKSGLGLGVYVSGDGWMG